ncbi:MAG: CYTH and CHAD domain-containing protein [Algicola sp.]|nr:CYTH and CHAD domain-containing protein [Algicola sp.]
MEIEIELKFLVSPSAGSALTSLVENFCANDSSMVVVEKTVHLANTYYDTANKVLRENDIGLRTRSTDGVWEQTIKTAGRVVGGLHQRHEYNIDIDSNQPNMALFDVAILPMAPDALQAALVPLFTTDFKRQIWRIKNDDCEFEMVFDQGLITSGQAQSPISEVELELIKGEPLHLFEFAQQLVRFLPSHQVLRSGTDEFDNDEPSDQPESNAIRIGFQSKAARGYQLHNDEGLEIRSYLSQVPLKQLDTLEMAFAKTLEYGLMFMQHHEQCFIDHPSLLALRRFTDGAALLRHGLWLYSMVVTDETAQYFRDESKWILKSFEWVEHSRQLRVLMSKTGKYRKRLDLNAALSQLLEEEAEKEPGLNGIGQFFSLPRYNQFILDISLWLIEKGWRKSVQLDFIGDSENALQSVASDLLNANWQSLLTVMPSRQQFTIADYVSHHQQLKRSLMTGSSVGALYSNTLRDDFRMPWLDLSRGIDELKTLHLLQSLAMKVEGQESRSTLNWLEHQIESLLLAMEQTRKSAVKMRPYWVN